MCAIERDLIGSLDHVCNLYISIEVNVLANTF